LEIRVPGKASYAVDGFLHLAVAAVAAFDRIGGGRQEPIVQEGQGGAGQGHKVLAFTETRGFSGLASRARRGVLAKHLIDTASQLGEIGRFAFPHYNHAPCQATQLLSDSFISIHILGELLLPEVCPALWRVGKRTALMSMPEAPVHEQHGTIPRQNDIGATWKIPRNAAPNSFIRASVVCILRPRSRRTHDWTSGRE
jgi:hypothetical protein